MSPDAVSDPAYAEALSLIEAGKREEAAAKLQRIIEVSPLHADARNDLGVLHYEAGEIAVALMLIGTAQRLKPDDHAIFLNLIDVYLGLGEIALALALIETRISRYGPVPELEQKRKRLQPGGTDTYLETTLITLACLHDGDRLELEAFLSALNNQDFHSLDIIVSSAAPSSDLSNLGSVAVRTRMLPAAGMSRAERRQSMLDASATELLLFCRSTDRFPAGSIRRLVEAARDKGLVAAVPQDFEPAPFRHVAALDEQSPILWDSKRLGEGEGVLQSVPDVSFIVRKSTVVDAGGFCTSYSSEDFRGTEDVAHRIWLKGYELEALPDTGVINASAQTLRSLPPARQSRAAHDALLFLKRAQQGRSFQQQLAVIREKKLPIRVAVFYDQEGWAWWHRAHHIKESMPPWVTVDVLRLARKFDHTPYDFLLIFDYNLTQFLPEGLPYSKIIIGNSCPKLHDEWVANLRRTMAAGGVGNNYTSYQRARHLGNVYCCQNGVDLEFFSPAAEPPLEPAACWVGNSGSIGNKGLDLIMDACAMTGVKLHFVDAKDDAQKPPEGPDEWLKVRAKPQEWIRDEIYLKSTFYVCASEFEGTPNPGLEALACGLPVISTRVGNMPELVVDGYNGFLVDRSARAIAEAIVKLNALPWAALSRNARRSVEDGWSWREQGKKYERMFLEVLRTSLFGPLLDPEVRDEEVTAALEREGLLSS